MRTRSIVVLLAAAALTFSVSIAFGAPAASAAPPNGDPATAPTFAAQWLAQQVNAQGFIPQSADPSQPNLSTSAQAVLALAAAKVGQDQINALVTYLGAHVEDFVVKSGNDDAGSLAYLIMDAVVAHQDPTSFGTSHSDLVARLQATKQPNGLFGASDPTFDGAFRQGLALVALEAVGATDAAATDWLAGQQCADGLWTAYRSDTTTPCPAVDPNMFTGPDTNSTALAVLGLQAQGRTAPASNGANALLGVRNAGGGWGFLARSDQPTDANSTGLVLSALLAATGTQDQQGTTALLALQEGCDATTAADVGGIAFQDLSAGPDALATAQATVALAGAVLPLGPTGAFTTAQVACASPSGPPPTDVAAPADPGSTATPESSAPVVGGEPLARTGSSSFVEVLGALGLLSVGLALVQRAGARRRRVG